MTKYLFCTFYLLSGALWGQVKDTVKIWTETVGGGHSWISVGHDTNLVVYSYGNYARSNPFTAIISHRGVMLRLEKEEAQSYIDGKTQNGKVTEFWAKDANPDDVRCYCDSIFYYNNDIPSKGRYAGKRFAHYYQTYRILRYNCTHFIATPITLAGSTAFLNNRGFMKRGILPPAWAKKYLRRKSLRQKRNILVLRTY